jgi:hypothetical protein
MPNTIAVTLTPGTSGNGQFEWNMSVDGKAQAPGTTPPIKADHGTSPDFSFTLQNAPNITFSSFLVPAGTTEIHHVSQVSGATTFTFKDHNKNSGDIPYEILFNGAPKLDPIISNGGGGTGFYLSPHMVEYAGYAIAAAVILFFVARRMMRNAKN